jgi:two-component system, cell cycle response regulator
MESYPSRLNAMNPELDETARWESSQAPKPDGSQRRAWLTVLTGTEAGRVYPLEIGEITIGRRADADIHLDDKQISRDHTKLLIGEDGTAEAWDCGSSNGTRIGTKAVGSDPHLIADGDQLHIGGAVVLRFSFRDHLEEHFERKLYDSATRDGLTGAFNKRFFADRLRQEFAHASRHSRSIALVLFDLDDFKAINDTHGHAAGDAILRRMSEEVAAELRDEETLCRYGGEEFVVLLGGSDLPEGLVLAERLRRLIQGIDLEWEGKQIPVTASFGVASISGGSDRSPERLFQDTDDCLYRAKRSGKNRVCGMNMGKRSRSKRGRRGA